MQIPPALTQPINLSLGLSKYQKGKLYQVNCHVLSKINFNLLTSLQIGYLNLWNIFRFIFRQLRMTFFQKIMVTEKSNSSLNA